MLFADVPPPPFQLNQASNENGSVPKFKPLCAPILIYPLDPSKLNALPTSIGIMATPPEMVPLCLLLISGTIVSEAKSALHQLTNPEGGRRQLLESLPPPPVFPSGGANPLHSCGC